MAGEIAVNDAGDVMVLQGDQWKPAPVAADDRGNRVYYDGQAWQPVPGAQPQQGQAPQPEAPSFGRRVLDTAVGAVQGLRDFTRMAQGAQLAGFGDEIQAGLNSAIGGSYDEELARERSRSEQYQRENPIAAGAATVVGSVVSPLSAVPTARMGALAGRLPGVVGRVAEPVVRGAVGGGLGGLVAGFGEGQGGFQNRLAAAGTGAAFGAATGAVLDPAMTAGRAVANRLYHGFGGGDPAAMAERLAVRGFERSGVDVPSLPAQAAAAHPDAALVDIGGRSVRNLGALAGNMPGPGQEVAERFVDLRRGARPDRIAAAVDDGFGGGGGTRVADDVAALRLRRQTEATPRYEASFNRIIPTDDEITRVLPGLEDRIGQDALARGLRVIEVENVAARLRDPNIPPFNPADYGVVRGEDGGFVVQNGYRNLRLLDAVKRGYDEIVEGFRDPTSGRLNLDQYGRAVNDARAGFVGNLRDMFPRYGGALDAWAGPSGSLDALAQGQRALGQNRDVVQTVWDNLSAGDRDFFRIGVGRAITDRTSDPARAAGAARLLLEDRQMQARLATAIPDPAQRQAFTEALQREVDFARVERTVSPNAGSQTARLQAADDDAAGGGLLLGALRSAATGGGAVGMVANPLFQIATRARGISPEVGEVLANRLMDPLSREASARALVERQMRDALALRAQQARRASIGSAIGVAAGLTAN